MAPSVSRTRAAAALRMKQIALDNQGRIIRRLRAQLATERRGLATMKKELEDTQVALESSHKVLRDRNGDDGNTEKPPPPLLSQAAAAVRAPSPPSCAAAAAAAARLRRKIISGQFDEENLFMLISSVLLVQADEGVSFLVVDRIGDIYRNLPRRADVIVTTVGARHKCQQDPSTVDR
ncbi:hypothetical protein F511_35732 [Dorcoceras hygrometricum]|uniref:Uncharacterized protein n=1 Tax=Dorcoceras hygrometricum TaxID=472368 RepID=A0A2Z7AAQ9_9LAMI|nr:hypothetical protein F511_35732 [Dorcoceras hygrometricum]